MKKPTDLQLAHLKRAAMMYAAIERARREHPIVQQRPAGAVHHRIPLHPK